MRPRWIPEALLRPLLTALTAIGGFGDVQDVAGIVVGLAIPVFHHQHTQAAPPANEILPALDAGLLPQPGDLEHRRILLRVRHDAPPVTNSASAASTAAMVV